MWLVNGLQMNKAAPAQQRAHLQRTKSVGFRTRPQEYDELVRAADRAGMPIGEWIREMSLRAARGSQVLEDGKLVNMVRVSLEELVALRVVVLTLFGTTNPNLAKEEIDQILAYADKVKQERVDVLMRRQT
jgi:mobilization protein NikA